MFHYFILFYNWIISHCIDEADFIFPLFVQLVGIWIVSIFRLLWMMPLLTFIYKFLCGHMFSRLLGIYLRVELLGHTVTLYLTFWETAKLFSKVAAPFYNSTSSIWGFQFLHNIPNICYYLSFLV